MSSNRRRRRALALGAIFFWAGSLVSGPALADDAPPPADPSGVRITALPGTVALTFDDGPHPVWTPVVLDVLAAHGVKATFFVLGPKVEAYPDIARRIVAEGHSLQNHGYGHIDLTGASSGRIAWHVARGSEAIIAATGAVPTCFRPPYGKTNGRISRIAADHGMRIARWNVDSEDYWRQSSANLIEQASEWEDGSVVVMHDTNGHLYDEGTLDTMIEVLTERGLGFSTICENPPRYPDLLLAGPPWNPGGDIAARGRYLVL